MTVDARQLIRNWALALLTPIPLLGVLRLPRYLRDWVSFARSEGTESLRVRDSYPCLADRTASTPFDPHYYYQGAWLSRRLAARRPKGVHVDVGSSVLTISVLSAFIDVAFVDRRPLESSLSGLHSVAADIGHLPFAACSVDSLSCLHVIEHIGLGRYGDPIDGKGAFKAAQALAALVAPGGRLYLSTPVGRERICFNAHRVFAPKSVIKMMDGLLLEEFSFVDDAGQLHEFASVESASQLKYGCGLFVFARILGESV